MRLRFLPLTALLTIALPTLAADIQPGMWALSMESKVASMPDFAPPPYTQDQCLTAQDAKDPSRVLGSVANPGANDCTYTEKDFSGDTFRFKMKCAGSLGIQASGEISYSATTMQGNITTTASVQGQTTEFLLKVSAHRTGSCS